MHHRRTKYNKIGVCILWPISSYNSKNGKHIGLIFTASFNIYSVKFIYIYIYIIYIYNIYSGLLSNELYLCDTDVSETHVI